MRRKAKSPKGPPRTAATRGGGTRGRGRSRGGSKASNETVQRETPVSQYSSVPGKVSNTTARRGAINNSLGRKDNQNIISNDGTSTTTAKGNELGASSSKGGQGQGVNNADPAKPFNNDQFYLHKKFKKLSTAVISDDVEATASCSSKTVSKPNGSNIIDYTSNTSDISCTNVNSSDSGHYSRNESAMEMSVIKPATQSISSSASEANSILNLAGSSSNNVVYKPKFRMSTDAEVKPEQNCSGYSSAASTSTRGDEPEGTKSSREPGKIGKSPRFDRQSLDDRISKIIVENQSLLEWPEHFTKKLKSHTSRNSQSSHNHHQRTNQLTIMSGGSTTELQPASGSSHRHHPPHHNGLVRHSSFDMASSGGTVEFLPTSPLLIKSSPDILNSTFNQVVQNSPNPSFSSSVVTDLSFPVVSANTSALIVPKKRRRMSPTPSRLCGGEVSELPVSDVLSSKNYYQDVDMTVRVSNCSGAKVTIRTNNGGSGGCVQSAVSFGRLIDPVPSPLPLNVSNKTLFFPRSSLEDRGLQLVTEEPMATKDFDTSSKRSKSRNSRKKLSSQSSIEPLQLDKKSASFEENAGVCNSTKDNAISSFIRASSTEKSKSRPKVANQETIASSKTPFQVLQNSATNPKRPNFLALKPVNSILKKSDVGVLPSPETPRVAKSYNQMFINGSAYTYLGFKVSTRSSYTCLFKPQPMFFQNTDPKLSMYSNWQPSPKDPKEMEVSMSTNDSRVNGRKSPQVLYTSAVGRNCDTMTVSSPSSQAPISSPMAEKNPLAIFANNSSAPVTVTSLSRSSEAVLPSPPSKSSFSPNMTASSSGSQQQPFTARNNGELIFNGASSPGSCSNGSQAALSKNNTATVISSSSDNELSSADESRNYRRNFLKRNRNGDSINDVPLALVKKSKRDSVSSLMREDSNSATDSMKSGVVMNRSDGSRVRIMEGGFESNEDYTYVRGRGRGKFVCAACGIRCKKPSMLRKHLKTHTDLRPYTCKLCNFSFKTKGNLTKHQKSKSHHKKCISMGIHPESSQSLATICPSDSENDSDEDDDDKDDDESDSQVDDDANSSVENDNDNESVEKEIALSLLDLSRMSRMDVGFDNNSVRSKHQIPSQPLAFSVNSMLEESSTISVQSNSTEAPIDLSVKAKPLKVIVNEEPEPKRLKVERNGFVRSVGVVGEAQLWEPEEELMSNGCLNLKKVLNTGSPGSTKKNIPEEIQLTREIKQEVIEFPVETPERLRNGYQSEFARKRQESETSNSSTSVLPPVQTPVITPASASTTRESPSPAASSNSAPVKLHQPWLSSPDKNNKDSDKEMDIESDIKVGPVSLERPGADTLEDIIVKAGGGHSSNLPTEITSPNSKLFSSLSGLRPQAEFRQPSGAQALVKDEGKAECNVCGKSFARASQLTLHMNIHYLERPFRCQPCGVSFRTKGHLIKHRRSSSHDCKVYLTEAWGVANEENPRPFKCPDCKIAFRIHGHLAKHLRSKMHIMRMECLGKLPFGIYFEMEKSGMNLNEIDTTDCDMSLVSLQTVARKIYGDTWMERLTIPVEEPAV